MPLPPMYERMSSGAIVSSLTVREVRSILSRSPMPNPFVYERQSGEQPVIQPPAIGGSTRMTSPSERGASKPPKARMLRSLTKTPTYSLPSL